MSTEDTHHEEDDYVPPRSSPPVEEWKPFTEAQPAQTYIRRWTSEEGDDESGYYYVKRSALERNPAWTAWNNRRIAHLATRPDDYDTEKWREFTEPAPTKTTLEAYTVEHDDEGGSSWVETRYRNVANPAWAAWNARKEENFKNRPYDRLTDEERAARNDEEVRKKIEEADKEARRRLDPDYVPPADTTPGGTTPPADTTPGGTTPPADTTPGGTTPPADTTPGGTTSSPYTPESLWGAGNVPMGVPGSTYTAPPPTDLGLDFYTPPPPTDVYPSFGTAGITGVTDPTTAGIAGITGIGPGSIDPLAGLTPFQMGGIASLKTGAGALQDYVRSNLSSGIGGHGSVLGSFS
jgi:hypothetical protein